MKSESEDQEESDSTDISSLGNSTDVVAVSGNTEGTHQTPFYISTHFPFYIFHVRLSSQSLLPSLPLQ